MTYVVTLCFERTVYKVLPTEKDCMHIDLIMLKHTQVCLTRCSWNLMIRVDQLCSQKNIKIFCGDVFGYHGYMFSNLGKEHHYVE